MVNLDASVPSKAVILAAGLGTRLSIAGAVAEHPKSLTVIGDRPILSWQIEALNQVDVGEILIVSGHMNEVIDDEVNRYRNFGSSVRTIFNARYSQTNNFQSLCLALEAIEGNNSVWVLNGDVVVSQDFFSRVYNLNISQFDGAFVSSKDPRRGQNMTLHYSQDGSVNKLAREEFPQSGATISTDIYLLQPPAISRLLRHHASHPQLTEGRWAQSVIGDLIEARSISMTHIEAAGLWAEIDDPEDLSFANSLFSQ